MATLGRPKTDWKSYPVMGDTMSAPQAAAFLKMKLNTLHRQMIRDRALCVTDGHARKDEKGHWVIHTSIVTAFEQKDS